MSRSIRKMSVIVVIALLVGLVLATSVGGQSQGSTKVAVEPCCQRHPGAVAVVPPSEGGGKGPAVVAVVPPSEGGGKGPAIVAVVPPSEGGGKGPAIVAVVPPSEGGGKGPSAAGLI